MYALDFISLLLSKDQPVQASSTISPDLRNMISMGTLGADKLHTPRIRDAEKQDNKRVAKGWKIQNLNKAVDSILASAGRLEKEIERETKYWEQILAVSDAGWSLCRMPNERHILGVRFGFSEGNCFLTRSSALMLNLTSFTCIQEQQLGRTSPQSRWHNIARSKHSSGRSAGSSRANL
jgi:mediator of RNA polymerase II transcription subunit 17